MALDIITRKDAYTQGLKRYFTGRPCKRGHVAERLVSNLTCMECTCGNQRLKERDHESERVRLRIWKQNNHEKVSAGNREYAARPEIKARQKAYYVANYEHIREGRFRRYAEQRDARLAYSKAWAEANPERVREYHRIGRRKRRATMRGSGGTHTATDLIEILRLQNHRCAYCRADLRRTEKHIDHIQPLALGGSNGRENLQYLCRPCNQSKSARDPIDYAKSIGLLV